MRNASGPTITKSQLDQKISVPQLVADVVRLYSQSSSPVIFTVPARAVGINAILGFSALFDMLRGHYENKGRFMESQRVWFGPDAVDRAIRSSFGKTIGNLVVMQKNGMAWERISTISVSMF